MIHLKELPNTNIIEFSIDGSIDQKGMKKFYDVLDRKSHANQEVRLYGEMRNLPSFENFKALLETMKLKLKAMSNISKYAILTDEDWLENLISIGDFVTPGILLKHFEIEEREKAMEWLTTDLKAEFSEEEYLTRMNVKNIKGTNIYSFTIDGKMDQGGMIALQNILKAKSHDEKINLMAIYKNFDGFDSFKGFYEGMKVNLAAIGNLKKYAVVTDKDWARKLAGFEGKLIPGLKIKSFALSKEDEAVQWLGE